MTVNPGFNGQKMVPSALKKIYECKQYLIDREKPGIEVEVDGNVSFDNVPNMVANGADTLVVGTSSLFDRSSSFESNNAKLREKIELGLFLRDEEYTN